MILDVLPRSAAYERLNPSFSSSFAFLRRPDLPTLAAGRHAIDGDRIFAIVQDYETKPLAEGFLEVHRRYIDIQYVVTGEELIGYAPLAGQPIQVPYVEDKDTAFLQGPADPIPLRAGQFAIFFPHDAHMPSRTAGNPVKVHKVVIKVEIRK